MKNVLIAILVLCCIGCGKEVTSRKKHTPEVQVSPQSGKKIFGERKEAVTRKEKLKMTTFKPAASITLDKVELTIQDLGKQECVTGSITFDDNSTAPFLYRCAVFTSNTEVAVANIIGGELAINTVGYGTATVTVQTYGHHGVSITASLIVNVVK